MPSFSERERAFEAKFAHDEEFRFLAIARRDKLFASWVAVNSELEASAGTDLMAVVLKVPNGPRHDDAMIETVDRILSGCGKPIPRETLLRALHDCDIQARQQLIATR